MCALLTLIHSLGSSFLWCWCWWPTCSRRLKVFEKAAICHLPFTLAKYPRHGHSLSAYCPLVRSLIAIPRCLLGAEQICTHQDRKGHSEQEFVCVCVFVCVCFCVCVFLPPGNVSLRCRQGPYVHSGASMREDAEIGDFHFPLPLLDTANLENSERRLSRQRAKSKNTYHNGGPKEARRAYRHGLE